MKKKTPIPARIPRRWPKPRTYSYREDGDVLDAMRRRSDIAWPDLIRSAVRAALRALGETGDWGGRGGPA